MSFKGKKRVKIKNLTLSPRRGKLSPKRGISRSSEDLTASIVAEVWKDLKDRFSQGDIFRVVELLEEFYHLHQDNLTIYEF
ncbi:hypothetical protein Lal_00023288 [Lupinus albus]|nr:hypothetical protein Lal_00023288 [Lupinus albus]